MRVVCIDEKCDWDDYMSSEIRRGNIYTVIEIVTGYGRFWWWPFGTPCYVLVGFPPDDVFPTRRFVEMVENDTEDIAYERTQKQTTNLK